MLNELLYLAVAVAVVVEAIKRPRRTAIDTALFFAALAVILDLTALSSQLRFIIPPLGTLVLTSMLLALPYLEVRLLDDYVGVARWIRRSAVAGLTLALLAVGILPAPIPGMVTLILVAYFVILLSYCAARFFRESRRAQGLVAARLVAVAIGSSLLGLILAIAVVAPLVFPQDRALVDLAAQSVGLVAGIAYLIGFAPPPILKRLWQESALRRFMQQVTRLSDVADLDDLIRRVEIAAGVATAGSRANIAMWDEPTAMLRTKTPDGTAIEIDTRTSVTLGTRVIKERRPILSEDPGRDFPSAAPIYKRLGVRAVLGAPISVRGRVFGVVAVQSGHPSLFGRDDADFLGLLADQIGIVIENNQLLSEVLRLTAHERQRGEEARARLAAIVESSPDAIIGSTLDGTVKDWNPAAERMYGYTAEEVVDRPRPAVVPSDRPDEMASIVARIRAGESVNLQTERVRKDGTRFNVSLSAAPLRDPDGAIVGVATIARDITERIAAESRQAELEARLRQSERLETVGRLAGGIAHDFNNLLAVVMNYTSFVEDKVSNDPELMDDLAQIRHAAERGAAFTRQLLTFAHQRPIHLEDVQINALIPDLRAMLTRSIPENIVVDVQLAPDLWTVHADASQLEQLLLNLVVNAGDAMPNGGRLIIETANAHYDKESAAQFDDLPAGDYVRLTVSDTGAGMTKDVVARAFEPFFTTKSAGKGTGLGLATVYGIVRQSGGRVSIYSELGHGTSIRALIPGRVGTSDAVRAPSPTTPPIVDGIERSTIAILVVEDEHAVRKAAVRILVASGYRVLEASDPADALSLARREPIDLLLTDMVMPGMSGRELREKLREFRPDLRVVYMSGYSEELLTRESGLEGRLLQKPFTRETLLAIVADTVASARV